MGVFTTRSRIDEPTSKDELNLGQVEVQKSIRKHRAFNKKYHCR